MKKLKKQIIIFNQYFYPAYKAGGPIKSLKLLKEQIDKKLFVTIFTSSFDIDKKKVNHQKKFRDIKNFDTFFSLIVFLFKNFFLKRTDCIVYFNSFFNLKYTILPLIFFKFFTKNTYIVLAPRGELFISEISKKIIKKKIYLIFFKLFLKQKIIFHATSLFEKKSIKTIFPTNKIKVLSNIVDKIDSYNMKFKKIKIPYRFIFFSRISRKKNLLKTINLLSKVRLPILLDLYGPIEDRFYWKKIQLKIAVLKKENRQLTIKYKGIIKFNKYKILNKYNFYILLSDSENFGHSIFEAIASKCFPIIPKNSPWAKYKKKGFNLLLDVDDISAHIKIENFIKKIKTNFNFYKKELDLLIKDIYQDQMKINYEKFFNNI